MTQAGRATTPRAASPARSRGPQRRQSARSPGLHPLRRPATTALKPPSEERCKQPTTAARAGRGLGLTSATPNPPCAARQPRQVPLLPARRRETGTTAVRLRGGLLRTKPLYARPCDLKSTETEQTGLAGPCRSASTPRCAYRFRRRSSAVRIRGIFRLRRRKRRSREQHWPVSQTHAPNLLRSIRRSPYGYSPERHLPDWSPP